MYLLMVYADHPGDVADPWYTGDFDATWQDMLAGCQGLLDCLKLREYVLINAGEWEVISNKL